jgi:hypothetical protein
MVRCRTSRLNRRDTPASPRTSTRPRVCRRHARWGRSGDVRPAGRLVPAFPARLRSSAASLQRRSKVSVRCGCLLAADFDRRLPTEGAVRACGGEGRGGCRGPPARAVALASARAAVGRGRPSTENPSGDADLAAASEHRSAPGSTTATPPRTSTAAAPTAVSTSRRRRSRRPADRALGAHELGDDALGESRS